jgi:hypothetical protein
MEEVEDSFVTDTGDRAVTVTEYQIDCLECGHQAMTKVGEYRSPLQQTSALPRAYDL